MIRTAFGLLCCACALATAAGLESHPDVQGASRLFDAWMRGQMEYRHLTGVAVGLIHDQQLIWTRSYGVADVAAKSPITPSTRFRTASHSKLFTATAVMQLRDAGKLRLDDPVSKYLPWFHPKPADPLDPSEITIEELLTHSSGLSREAGSHWTDYQFPDEAALRKYVDSGSASTYSPEHRWKYSNLAFSVAALLVEAVSGEKYADYLQKHVFDPLGMSSSSVDKKVDGLATGYGRRLPDGSRVTMPFIDARAMAGATGITSTVEDMARFVSLQFRRGPVGGAQILSTGALRQMHRVRMLENNWTRGNAIGFSVTRDRDRLYIGHGGVYPGYTTHTLIQLDDKVGVIILTNAADSDPATIAARLMNTMGVAVARAAAAPVAPKVSWDPGWSRFAGRYRSRFGDTEVVELNQRLVVINPALVALDEPSRLVPIGNGQFRLEAPVGGLPIGETVRFTEENGRVVRIHIGGSYFDRVP